MGLNGNSIRYVYFDVGRVLVNALPDARHMAEILGILNPSEEEVTLVDHAMWAHRDSYDRGMSDFDFWNAVAGDCGLPEPSTETVERLVFADYSRSEHPDPAAVQLAHDLKDTGLTLGILSNAPLCIATHLQQQQWAKDLFSTYIFSGEIGTAKPEQEIYRLAVKQAGIPAEQILFFDDREINLRGAELVGMKVLLWESAAQARQTVTDWKLLR